MQCSRCQQENRAGATFCDACGIRLSTQCRACGIAYRLGAAFCDACGISLTASTPASCLAPSTPRAADAESRFHALLRAVMGLLQREKRVTYRELKYVFGIDDALVEEIREALTFKQVACDQASTGLVWTGDGHPAGPPVAETTGWPLSPEAAPVASSAPSERALSNPATDAVVPAPEASSAPTVFRPEPELARSAPEAERRQLTVMFCDLADSTTLSQQLDPEDLREVIRAYQEMAAAVIHQYEGHIAQYLGDGLLIYFGWPQAHEDDAQRALHAGLGIVEAMTATLNPRLEREKGVRLTVRLGVHTGAVVVGEMGSGGRQEHLATGDTVNIAARLEGLAAPNTVVMSQVTARLVRDAFVLEALGTHTLKGVAEPMEVFRVDDVREVDTEDSGTGGFEALVGRDEEIGLLLRRWEQSKEGLGQVVLLSGEAGIGKSSLTEGLRQHVRQEGVTRITFRCSEYVQHSALSPVIAHLHRVLGWQRDDDATTRLATLERVLESTSLPLDEAVPLLAALLSLPLPADHYPALTLTPQQQRQQTQDVLVAWMLEEAERQPVLVVWEDLHWADPSTLELLGLFIDQVPTVSMLQVLVYRPTFVPPWPLQSHLTPLTLHRLERPQVEVMIQRVADGKGLPQEVVAHIVAKTDGVPLYVEELTKMLLESALLQEEAEQYTLTGPLAEAAIPATLYDSLMARLDRLPTVREVAQLGAVLGREFAYEMLQSLAAVEEPTLQEGLSQLVVNELLYQRGRPPRAKYTFRHALIRDTAYQSLLRRTRQHYHHQVAQLLEARFPEVVETQPELVAHHYTAAGQAEQAVTYYLRAGERSTNLYANTEAITYYEQAITLLNDLPATDATRRQRVELHLRLASLHVLLGHYSDSLPSFAQALETAAALGDVRAIAHVETRLGRVYYSMGDYERARVSLERALTLSQQTQDTIRMAICYQSLGYVYFSCDRLAKVIECFTQALQISEAAGNQEGIAVACTDLSNAHARAGNLAESVQWGRRALELGEHIRDDRRIAWACIMLAQGSILTGSFAEAQALLQRAWPLSEHVGDFLAQAWVHIWSGDVLARGDKDFEGALEHAQHVIRMGTESGGFSHEVSHQFARGAEALLRLGRVREAHDYCQQGLAIAQPASNKLESGYASMVLAEVHASEAYRDWDKAVWYLDESLKAFREVGATVDVGRAHLAGARIARLREDDTARRWAAQARDIFAERGANALLKEAAELLAALHDL
jgi:predicted ATPase/class 3 adenylate cyclase